MVMFKNTGPGGGRITHPTRGYKIPVRAVMVIPLDRDENGDYTPESKAFIKHLKTIPEFTDFEEFKPDPTPNPYDMTSLELEEQKALGNVAKDQDLPKKEGGPDKPATSPRKKQLEEKINKAKEDKDGVDKKEPAEKPKSEVKDEDKKDKKE